MSLLAAVIRSLRPAPAPVPEPIATATAAEPIQPQRPEPPDVTIYEKFILRRSPLATAPSATAADVLDTIYRNKAVQRAAGTCAANGQRLLELAGFRAEIANAIHVVLERSDLADLSAAAVAEVLRQRAEGIDDAIDDVRRDHAVHDAESRKLMERHAPLRNAVSARLTALTNERERLVQADDSARRAHRLGLVASRFAELRRAGLNDSQIAEVLPGSASPEVAAAHRQARIIELAGQIERLRAFAASPTFDAAPLAGLGFDDLIAARRAAERAAAV
jgi:hypothetical protein